MQKFKLLATLALMFSASNAIAAEQKTKITQHPVRPLDVYAQSESGHIVFCDFDATNFMRIAITPVNPTEGLLLSMQSASGKTLIANTRIADRYSAIYAFWSHLNQDNKRDYVIIAWSGGATATISFMLSSKTGYRLRTLETLMPKAADFIAIKYTKKSKPVVRFVHTTNFKIKNSKEVKRVESLLEFDGTKIRVDKKTASFPRVHLGRGKSASVAKKWIRIVLADIESKLVWRSRIELDKSIAEVH